MGIIYVVWFKSDRCGIEILLWLVCLRLMISFKSDRCGIEIKFIGLLTSRLPPFKSDRCGIEIDPPDSCVLPYPSSNQTVAGLKLPTQA